MQVFISWSQPTSREIAKVLKNELYTFFNEKIEFWVSSEDILAGEVSITKIISALQNSDMIITCLDASNYNKSWLYFETGAVFGRQYNPNNVQSVVFPIIFDDLEIAEFNKTPFKELQLQKFNKGSIEKIAKNINQKYRELTGELAIASTTFEKYFKDTWSNLYDSVNNIIVQQTMESDNVITKENVTEKLSRYANFPSPAPGSVIRYDSGFETSYFYDFLLENVKKRLYIFGRKNRKITDKTLNTKLKSVLNNNVDLRMLFLNPNSAQAKDRVAQDTDRFRDKLLMSINELHELFKSENKEMSQFCRMYNEQRESEIIIADEVVFYKDLAYSEDGKPLHFTNQSFCITAINNPLGNKYFTLFEKTWKKAETDSITDEFIESLFK